MNLHEKKSGFLNKALRPRSLRSLAPPTACWDKPKFYFQRFPKKFQIFKFTSSISTWRLEFFKTFREIIKFEIRLHRDFWPQCALDDCQNFPLHTWSLKGCVREIRTRCNNKNLAKLGMLCLWCLWWCPNLADLLSLSDFNCFFKHTFLSIFFYLCTFLKLGQVG